MLWFPTTYKPLPGVSLAKAVTRFVCQSCGAVTVKWAGHCETCDEWNTIEPETIVAYADRALVLSKGRVTAELAGADLTKDQLMKNA